MSETIPGRWVMAAQSFTRSATEIARRVSEVAYVAGRFGRNGLLAFGRSGAWRPGGAQRDPGGAPVNFFRGGLIRSADRGQPWLQCRGCHARRRGSLAAG